MAIGSVLQTGLNGMQRSSREIQKSAQEIVNVGTVDRQASTQPVAEGGVSVQAAGFNPSDLNEPLVNMMVEELIFDASAKVVQTGSDTLGTLLDIKA